VSTAACIVKQGYIVWQMCTC